VVAIVLPEHAINLREITERTLRRLQVKAGDTGPRISLAFRVRPARDRAGEGGVYR
jgi:hypothetical protein